jgi:amino acid transporter
MAESDPAYERLGAKVLSLPDVIAQSVGFMGPVFSSAFVIPLVVGVISASGKGGGVASPLSVLIAAVGVFAIGWIVARYAREIHAAGSLYDYVTRGLGKRVGTAAGWLYYVGVTVLLTGLLLLIGGYLQSTIASEFSVNPLPAWAWTLIIIALVTAVLYFGVRISVRSQLVLALVSIVVVTVFFIVVIAKLGSANSARPFEPSSSADGWGGIFFGVLYGVLLFVGFETAANLAEETPSPHRHIPAAVMITAGIATVFFILAAYVEVAGFHYSLKTLTAAAGGAAVRAGRAQVGGRLRRHLDRPAARARGAVRHARGGHRLRRVLLPRDLRHGPRPPDPGRFGHHLPAA